MKIELLREAKKLAKTIVTEQAKFQFINDHIELMKLDDPGACSGQIVWKDDSRIEFGSFPKTFL